MPKGDNIGNSLVYLQDTTLHEPSNSIHDVLIKRYDFGEKETEIYSDTFRYTGAMTLLDYALKKNWKIIK